MENKCAHCGADEGLHQYETMKCPYGGYEAPIEKEQIWDDKIFTVKENYVPWLKQQLKAKDELIEWYERRFAQILDCKYEADKIMCIVDGTLGKSQKEILSGYRKAGIDIYAPPKITQRRMSMESIYEFYVKGNKVIIDKEDMQKVIARKWHIVGPEKVYLACYDKELYGKTKKNRKIRLHRFIIKAKKGQIIDHINGNAFDNRKCNLRICTKLQNNGNAKKSKLNSTGYKGVSRDKKTGKYRSAVRLDGKVVTHGGFKSPYMAWINYQIQACKAYDEFANFGEEPINNL